MGSVNAELLAQLAPAHAPPPPGWWPPAPGWWVLAALLLVMIVALVYALRRPSWRLRRAALRELKALECLEPGSCDDVGLARGLEHLLRRYALARFGRERVARLSGDAWIDFVVDHGGSTWAGKTGQDLLRAAYGGGAGGDSALWLAGARGFLRSPSSKSPPPRAGEGQGGGARRPARAQPTIAPIPAFPRARGKELEKARP